MKKRIVLAISVLLTACGGGGIGKGQAPDPVAVDVPIAYVKRAPLRDDDGQLQNETLRNPSAFNPGAHLFLRDRASASATEKPITDRLFSAAQVNLYDVKDISASYDGDKIIFALHYPEIENAEVQPTWNIWEYQISTDSLRRVISSDIVAESGHDTGPVYLPDGRIVFTSTRQQASKARLLDEGKPQYAGLAEGEDNPVSVLHRMQADGSQITQLSFNQSHDLYPSVLTDGRIVFSRWDHMGSVSRMQLYTLHPDGTELSIYYGAHSHATGTDNGVIQFTRPQVLADGSLLSLIRPFDYLRGAGQLVRIDGQQFSDVTQPINSATPASVSAQQNLTSLLLTTDESMALGGRLNAAQVLHDGPTRLLINWSPCRLQNAAGEIFACLEPHLSNPQLTEADPLFGIWVLDWQANTQLPILQGSSTQVITDVVAVEKSRSLPALLADKTTADQLTDTLKTANLGSVLIRSVYDFAGVDTAPSSIAVLADAAQSVAADRPYRFVRVVKAVPIPDEDEVDVADLNNEVFGASSQQLMREIVGYAPIEPDGSVHIAVPADVPLEISLLNAKGERVSGRHQNWLQVRPGETRECNGCHRNSQDVTPHGRIGGEVASINPNLAQAEIYAADHGIRQLTLDLRYQDDWTNPAIRAPDAAFQFNYADLLTPAPASSECQTSWTYLCRSVINYPTHIQPLWELPRKILDVDNITVLADHTCVSCHNAKDAMNAAQIPAGQLELTDGVSLDSTQQVVSYRELFFADNQQELVNGVLTDKLVVQTDAAGNPVFQTDGAGNLILDGAGQPIPVTRTVGVSATMSTQGAAASRFLTIFNQPGATVDHRGYLSDVELKLLREWLDIGGQYYNNPFDVPKD